MRLSSLRELINLLEGLQSLGFVVPFKDYEQELKNAGMTRHIHCYECKIRFHNDKENDFAVCNIWFFDGENKQYVIPLRKESNIHGKEIS